MEKDKHQVTEGFSLGGNACSQMSGMFGGCSEYGNLSVIISMQHFSA